MDGVSAAFNNIADVWDSFENIGPKSSITTAKPLEENVVETEAVSVVIDLEIPFLNDSAITNDTEIQLRHAEIAEEGALRLQCLVRAFSNKTDTGSAPSPGIESTPETNAITEESTENHSKGNDTKTDSAVDEEGTREFERSVKQAETELAEVSDDEAESSELPAYQDPERLREVYEKHSTFTEMTEGLDVDVTPQTVRRYMIKHDIHKPSPTTGSSSISTLLEADPDSLPIKSDEKEESEEKNDESTQEGEKRSNDGEAQIDENDDRDETTQITTQDGGRNIDRYGDISEQGNGSEDSIQDQLNADMANVRIDVPDEFTISDIRDIVYDANTLYDVEQAMGLERSEVRELLQELNLLDLVHGRLSNRNLQKKTVDEINERIKTAIHEND